jgi:hypothetical protein
MSQRCKKQPVECRMYLSNCGWQRPETDLLSLGTKCRCESVNDLVCACREEGQMLYRLPLSIK